MAESVEKAALDKADRNKMIKSLLAASLAAAGVGAFVKNLRARKKREEASDVASSKNAIVVPIEKSKFMEGLPTPNQHASEFGSKSVTSSPESAPGDVNAIKRDILRSARKIDFFKRAKDDGADKTDVKDEGKGKPSNEDTGSDRTVLRDQSGRFVSPTDPVAVESSEKKADYDWGKGVWGTLAHPVETAKMVYEAAKDKPVAFAAGGVASIILAAKISDVINKFRREKAKERLENARGEYVKLLESSENEKAAQATEDPRSGAGVLIGASLFVPMAITALVTNRIIENRRREKKREKEMSDSYPEEPVILYKTSEDKSIRITPETALFAIMMKQAMIESAERDEREAMMCKSAFLGGAISNGLSHVQKIGDKIEGMIPGANMEQAEDIVMKVLEDPRNNDILFELAQNPDAGITPDMEKKIRERTSLGGQLDLATVAKAMKDPKFKADLMSRVKTGNRMQNLIVSRATSDDYADTWGKFKDDKINDYLGKTFTKGSVLHRIFSWILRNTGLGNYFAKNHINDYFNSMRSAHQNNVQPQQIVPKNNPNDPKAVEARGVVQNMQPPPITSLNVSAPTGNGQAMPEPPDPLKQKPEPLEPVPNATNAMGGGTMVIRGGNPKPVAQRTPQVVRKPVRTVQKPKANPWEPFRRMGPIPTFR